MREKELSRKRTHILANDSPIPQSFWVFSLSEILCLYRDPAKILINSLGGYCVYYDFGAAVTEEYANWVLLKRKGKNRALSSGSLSPSLLLPPFWLKRGFWLFRGIQKIVLLEEASVCCGGQGPKQALKVNILSHASFEKMSFFCFQREITNSMTIPNHDCLKWTCRAKIWQ